MSNTAESQQQEHRKVSEFHTGISVLAGILLAIVSITPLGSIHLRVCSLQEFLAGATIASWLITGYHQWRLNNIQRKASLEEVGDKSFRFSEG